jgi:hypothetical protein
MIYVVYCTTLIAVAIVLATLVALVRGGQYRRYPIFFSYLIILGVTAGADLFMYAASQGWTSGDYRQYFWANEAVRQFSVYVLVLSLIDLANSESPHRGRIRRWLVVGSVAVLVLSWFIHQSENPDLWMTLASRNVSFAAVVLNFLLWSLLIKWRRGDPRLLMISGALGLQMAGEAIGQSLRQMGLQAERFGNVIMVGSYLLGLLMWWFTFRKTAVPVAKVPAQ